MKFAAAFTGIVLLAASTAIAGGTKTYQVTGPVLETKSDAIVVQKGKDGTGAFGFNAETEEYEDLLAAGIIDPTKVTRVALQHAASIAGLMVTTVCLISDIPEKEKAPAMPPGGGDMGGMGGMY